MKKLVIFVLLLVLSISLTGCNKEEEKSCTAPEVLVEGECVDPGDISEGIYFVLIGDPTVTFEVGDTYIEKGFIAKDDATFISDSVTITSDVNMAEVGLYEVTYTLDYDESIQQLTRVVIVTESTDNINDSCTEIDDTDLLLCEKIWSQYLHTVVKLRLYIEKDSLVDSEVVFDHIEERIAYYNIFSDKYKEYEGITNVWAINQDPATTHAISESLFDMIEFTFEKQEDVDNLFNAALGPVLQVWHNYREDCNTGGTCAAPTMEELLAKNAYTDPSKVILDRENLTITMEENMSIDLGGVSKGYISGVLLEYLDTLDIHGYLLNNGESNISIGGLHPTRETGEFILAVTDPSNPFTYYATINLRDGDQLVTSGDYQQYFTVGDDYYHHIIHNETLMPERYNRSVSIVTNDPALADLYSTAIFLMPTQEGIAFVNSIDGLEGIWYDIDGTIHYSANFESQYLRDVVQ